MPLGIALMVLGALEFTLATLVFDVPLDMKILWVQLGLALTLLGAGFTIRGFLHARPKHFS